mmetsp:Transcript_1506/g.3452  ORF Transcript_1506/g.3452 Transcript_1506/m.3452 type:complete len:211 (+) Transcript_1506:244-876(+)
MRFSRLSSYSSFPTVLNTCSLTCFASFLVSPYRTSVWMSGFSCRFSCAVMAARSSFCARCSSAFAAALSRVSTSMWCGWMNSTSMPCSSMCFSTFSDVCLRSALCSSCSFSLVFFRSSNSSRRVSRACFFFLNLKYSCSSSPLQLRAMAPTAAAALLRSVATWCSSVRSMDESMADHFWVSAAFTDPVLVSRPSCPMCSEWSGAQGAWAP